MVAGVAVGNFSDRVRLALERVSLDGTSLPIALGLWLMIGPVFVKVRCADSQFYKKKLHYRKAAPSRGPTLSQVRPCCTDAARQANSPGAGSELRGKLDRRPHSDDRVLLDRAP